MNTENWSFEKFSNWLTAESENFRKEGFLVELQSNDSARSSIRLRIERKNRVGELTVWVDGTASEAVVDLAVGGFVHMRDGIRLDGEREKQLEDFFEQTRK